MSYGKSILVLVISFCYFTAIFAQKPNAVFAACSCFSWGGNLCGTALPSECSCGGASSPFCQGITACGPGGERTVTQCYCDSESEARDAACGGGAPNYCLLNKGQCGPANSPFQVWRKSYDGDQPGFCYKMKTGPEVNDWNCVNNGSSFWLDPTKVKCDWSSIWYNSGVPSWTDPQTRCGVFVNDACSCGSTDTSSGGGCVPGGVTSSVCGTQSGLTGGICKWYDGANVDPPAVPDCGPGQSCRPNNGSCGPSQCSDVCGSAISCADTPCVPKTCYITSVTNADTSASIVNGSITSETPIRITYYSSSDLTTPTDLARLFIERSDGAQMGTTPLPGTFDGSKSYLLNDSTVACSSAGVNKYNCTVVVNAPLAAVTGGTQYLVHCDIPSTLGNIRCTGSPFCDLNRTSQPACSGWRSCDSLSAQATPPALGASSPDWTGFTVTPLVLSQPTCSLSASPNPFVVGVSTNPITATVTQTAGTYTTNVNRVVFATAGTTVNPTFVTSGSFQTNYVSGLGYIYPTAYLNSLNVKDPSTRNIIFQTLTNYWTMDENSPAVKAFDYVSADTASVVGSVSNTTGSAGSYVGNGRSFSGGYLRLNSKITSRNINLWFRPTDISTDQTLWYTGAPGCYLSLGISGGKIYVKSDSTAAFASANPELYCPQVGRLSQATISHSTNLVANTWNMISLQNTDGGFGYNLCLNGNCQNVAGGIWGGGPTNSSNIGTSIGARIDGSGAFSGAIDEVGVWSAGYNVADLKSVYPSSYGEAAFGALSCSAYVYINGPSWWQVRGGSVYGKTIKNLNLPTGKYLIDPLP